MAILTEVWEILGLIVLTLLLKCSCQKEPHWGITPATGSPTATRTQEIFCNGFFEEVIEGR